MAYKVQQLSPIDNKKWVTIAKCHYPAHAGAIKSESQERWPDRKFRVKNAKKKKENDIIKFSDEHDDLEFLKWLYDRMVNIYDERVNYDYMIKFKNILIRMDVEREIERAKLSKP